MDLTTAALGLIPAVLLCAQGIDCLSRARESATLGWFGLLALTLGSVAGGLGVLSLITAFVPSHEFGVVMAQGRLGLVGLYGAVVGLAVAGSLGWHVVRCRRNQPSRLRWLFLPAALVAVLFLFSPQPVPLNTFDAPHVWVYRYDLLWLPLALWMTVCFTEASAAILHVSSWAVRIWAATTALAGLGAWAVHQPRSHDIPLTDVWDVCLRIASAASVGLFTWAVFSRTHGATRPVAVISAGVGILHAAMVTLSHTAGAPAWVAWAGSVIESPWAVVGYPVALLAFVRGASTGLGLSVPTWRQVVGIAMLLAIGLATIDLIYMSILPPVIPLLAFGVAWTVLAELAFIGRLTSWARWCVHRSPALAVPAPSPGGGAPEEPSGAPLALTGWVGRVLSKLTWLQATLGVLAVFLILVLANEIPNAGRTLIQPFAGPVDDKLGLGPMFTQRLVNEMGKLEAMTRPDAVRDIPQGQVGDTNFRLIRSGETSVEAVLEKSRAELKFWGIEIAPGLLVAPFRAPLRRILGVREVEGSLTATPDAPDKFLVVAQSNRGGAWQVPSGNADPSVAVAELARRLAFEIASSPDATAPILGGTRSWPAFDDFTRGIVASGRLEAGEDGASVDEILDALETATQRGPGFSLAHYRLGLARRKEGNPTAAIKAFRAAINASPELMPVYTALASTLYDFRIYAEAHQVPVPAAIAEKPYDLQARRSEARRLWLQVITAPRRAASTLDAASAYYGLCRYTLDLSARRAPGPLYGLDDWRHLAFYYCTRSERLYASLPGPIRQAPRLAEARAAVLNTLGDVFTTAPGRVRGEDGDGRCRSIAAGAYVPAALKYYGRAVDVFSGSAVFRCNEASAAWALGRTALANAVESDGTVWVAAGDLTRRAAASEEDDQRSAAGYRRALQRYREAVKLGARIDALAGYVRAFAEWRLRHPLQTFDAEVGEAAETYARTAKDLASPPNGHAEVGPALTALGEVLLAMARPHEAIEPLARAVQENTRSVASDRARWALAQAYICASVKDKVRGRPDRDVQDLRARARPLFDEVRANEQRRGLRLFSADPRYLDPADSLFVCTADTTAVTRTIVGTDWYGLRGSGPTYRSSVPCRDDVRLRLEVFDGEQRASRRYLHVWGWGMAERLQALLGPVAEMLIRAPAGRDFFVQLEDDEQRPVSDIYEIEVPGAPAGRRCSANLITTIFDRER